MSIEELSDMLNQDKKGIKGVFNKSLALAYPFPPLGGGKGRSTKLF